MKLPFPIITPIPLQNNVLTLYQVITVLDILAFPKMGTNSCLLELSY